MDLVEDVSKVPFFGSNGGKFQVDWVTGRSVWYHSGASSFGSRDVPSYMQHRGALEVELLLFCRRNLLSRQRRFDHSDAVLESCAFLVRGFLQLLGGRGGLAPG